MNGANQILDVDPTHPLPAVSYSSAESHFESREHFPQRSSFGTQYDSGTHEHRTNAHFGRGARCRLPLLTKFGQETTSRRALFGEDLVLAISVIPDCGTADEHLRLVLCVGLRP